MTTRAHRLDGLPLYADDLAIGAAVLGKDRAKEWAQMAPLLEQKGLPKIDTEHGGRYVQSVARWYDYINGATTEPPRAPQGVERTEGLWDRKSQKRRA
jgi:hypothetical protein